MNELDKIVKEAIEKKNNTPIEEFEGYSPNEMHFIIHDPFKEKSPIQISNAKNSTYKNIPIFNQVKFLFDLIKEDKKLKLTNSGYLPPKIVAELYGKGYMKEPLIESGVSKLYREIDSPSVNLAKILVELSTLVKKQKNTMTLTQKGAKQINDDSAIFQDLFKTFTNKFHWAYFDGFSDEDIGQLGFGFSLILLNKYGKEYRRPEFYAEKYLKAFKFKTKDSVKKFGDDPTRAYMVRTFKRFLEHFNFIEFDNDQKYLYVRKTKTFDELVKIRKHKNSL